MVPVDAARRIGEQYRVDQVVILAYARDAQLIHAATWGRSPSDKQRAIMVRDECLDLLSVDRDDEVTHQDYRTIESGERAQLVDELVRVARAADELLARLSSGFAPLAEVRQVRGDIQQAISKV